MGNSTNTYKKSWLAPMGTALATVILSGSAIAQDATGPAGASGDHRMLEETVVTARRREETAQSVPIPISALSSAELESRGVLDMTDLSRVTPNLTFTSAQVSKNSALVFLRGIGQVNWGPAQDPKVGIYLDGVYLSRPQGAIFDLIDVERVEVLRGPQGTLFGRNTTAGLVHVITKRPGDEFEASVQALAGDDGQFGIGGWVNVPLGETLAGRAVFQHRESDGYIKNRFDGTDWLDENAQNARASLLWTPTDRFDALLSFDYQRVDELGVLHTCRFVEGGAGGVLEGFQKLAGLYEDIRDNCLLDNDNSAYKDEQGDSTVDAWGTALTLTYAMNDNVTLTSITAYRDAEQVNAGFGVIGGSPSGTTTNVGNRTPGTFDQFSQEVRLNGVAMNDRLQWIGGLYYFTEDVQDNLSSELFKGWTPPDDCIENPQQTPCLPHPFGTNGFFVQILQGSINNYTQFDVTNDSLAAFAEVSYDLTDALAVTAGIRYTEDDRQLSLLRQQLNGAPIAGYICPDGSSPVADSCTRKGTFSKTTPRFIVKYQVNDDFMAYGSWSVGYSSGGFDQTPTFDRYAPEESKNWELGFKSTWFDRRVKLNMTTFYNTYENQQLTVSRIVNGTGVSATFNAQEATLYGIEVDLVALLGNWTLSAALGTTDGKYEEFNVVDSMTGPAPLFEEIRVERDLSSQEIISGSPYTVSLGVGYHHNLGAMGALDSNVGWSYRGRQLNSVINKVPATEQDAYGIMDARVTWTMANTRTSFSLVANNLLDEQYFTTAVGTSAANEMYGYVWGTPRRIRLELKHRFGG